MFKSYVENKFKADGLFNKTITMCDCKLTIASNNKEAIDYFENLYYPRDFMNINGGKYKNIAVYNVCIDITELQKLKEELIKEEYKIGECHPHWESVYNIYLIKGYKIYTEMYDTIDSNAHIIAVNDNSIYIFTSKGLYDYKILSRLIREFEVRKRENDGYVVFHASLVENKGKGVMIVGNSGAGKSTMALTLCKYYGFNYISNDRIMVNIHENGTISAVPVIFPIRINYGSLITLGVEEKFSEWKLKLPKPNEDSDWKNYNGDKKLSILPKELEKYLNIKLSSETNLVAVLFPELVKDDDLIDVREEGKLDILKNNCYSPNDPHFIEDWLGKRSISNESIQNNANSIINGLSNLMNLSVNYTFDRYMDICQKIFENIV